MHNEKQDIAADNEHYQQKKETVSANPAQYYPMIDKIRFSLTGNENRAQIMRIPDFINKYSSFDFGTLSEEVKSNIYIIEGKIFSIRKAGKSIIFVDLVQDYCRLQVIVSNSQIGISKEELFNLHNHFKRGDAISVIGFPMRTKAGELSIRLIKPISLASPALQPVPPALNEENRKGNRIANYLIDRHSKDIILSKSYIINNLRNFLTNKGFIEVETPIIAHSSKGANANPFLTNAKKIKDTELQLRVAPELWLKKLIIGGFDKIFEIGKVFRNEGLDPTHNIEFTTCEFYQTFINLEDLMKISEDMLNFILKNFVDYNKDVLQNTKLDNYLSEISTYFQNPFKRLDFIETIEKQTKIQLPLDLSNVKDLLNYFSQLNIEPPILQSAQNLLNELCSLYVEPLCEDPTFIYNHPAILSPLAKSTLKQYSRNRNYEISLRFELFMKGKELINAYEEENNPFKQDDNFKIQLKLKEEFNDNESLVPDYKYVKTMEYGMPPTGGWGIGIDRLTMLLTNSNNIDDVLSFGKLTDVIKQ
ncbi:lysine--tRNA ligase MSK1 [Ascoidea rubescens DSM 1968]|uniref:Lysyl-tRNA synthetase n=1 Tax=Ascoidea rubescens DSM 1968 TaxID=1344418 RepID=A0A1D2VC80_9ASCO|nr:mitochondrial lysine-tRNA synthetase [Ascoidea rubescens DSM 1968]ODV59083.1 mitochondrial lysine-tRNA synthetase [Ascoidea rubescens DSM 1968]